MSEREIATIIARLDALDRTLTTGLKEIKEERTEDRKDISKNSKRISYVLGMVAALTLGLPFLLQQLT